MLLSSGRFAVYRAETHVFTTVSFRFDLGSPAERLRFLETWVRSDLFQLSGWDAAQLRTEVLRDCRSAGDFLRIFMEGIARLQRVERWAEKTPEHLLSAAEIKQAIPNAQFIHIIRDGRDVAASMGRLGYIPALPWDKDQAVPVAGLYWEWLIREGRKIAPVLGRDYLEVRYEDLIARPEETLDRVGTFIGCELNHAAIRQKGIGSVNAPNTAYPGLSAPYVGRWREVLSASVARRLEETIAPMLAELGYQTEFPTSSSEPSLAARRMRASYHALFHLKLWLKRHRPFNRMVRLHQLQPGFVSSGNAAAARASGLAQAAVSRLE